MQRIAPIVALAGVIALASSAAAQVVVDMPPPPPPAPKAQPIQSEAGSAPPPTTHVDAGRLALNRYVGAQISPVITTAPAGGPLAYAYGLSARYRSIGWDGWYGWYGGWYGGPGWWGCPLIVHPKHPVFPGHSHGPGDFFSGSFRHSSSKWNIRLRF